MHESKIIIQHFKQKIKQTLQHDFKNYQNQISVKK